MVAADLRLGQCSVVRMALVTPTTTQGRMPRLGQAGLLSRKAWPIPQHKSQGGDQSSQSSQAHVGEAPRVLC